MTPVFVDTSALYAVLDVADDDHEVAARRWGALLDGIEDGSLTGCTHHGVVIESAALVQRRLGMDAARVLHDRLVPALEITWIDADLHGSAVTALLAAGNRAVSLVDWLSFEMMRGSAVTQAFAFDGDFDRQGFSSFEAPDER